MTPRGRTAATALAALLAARLGASQVVAPRAPAGAERQVTLSFNERGILDPLSAASRGSLASLAAGSTDVFILTHGWRNDAASADCRYQLQIQGISAALPAAARPVFVKIMWPSAMFPIIHDGCGTAPSRPFFADQEEHAVTSDVRIWAAAAFPAAARSRRFDGDVERLSQLLNTGGAGQDARSARVREAAAILVRWRDDADGPASTRAQGIDGPGERAAARTVDEVVTQYETIQSARPGRAPWSIVPSIAEVFSFWTMKARAGTVGSTGVHDVLREIAATLPPAARLHLVGHSFGGKLLAAALVGRPGVEPASVETLTVLQGALSHFAFSTAEQIRRLDVPTDTGGAYADVLLKKLAAVVAVTYSQQDRENQRWYPLGTMLPQDAFERGVPVYAALGARGMEGPASVAVTLREESVAARYSPSRPRIFNIDASGVVLGHSDVTQPGVYRIVADVVAVARRARASEAQNK
jgi:hypothetical protein